MTPQQGIEGNPGTAAGSHPLLVRVFHTFIRHWPMNVRHTHACFSTCSVMCHSLRLRVRVHHVNDIPG